MNRFFAVVSWIVFANIDFYAYSLGFLYGYAQRVFAKAAHQGYLKSYNEHD